MMDLGETVTRIPAHQFDMAMISELPDGMRTTSIAAHSRTAFSGEFLMPDIRAVVFDFGGVLFDWNADYLYRELIPDEAERRWFLTHICSPDWNLKQDCGRSIAEAEAELIASHPDHADLIRAFYGQWPKTLLLFSVLFESALKPPERSAPLPLFSLQH